MHECKTQRALKGSSMCMCANELKTEAKINKDKNNNKVLQLIQLVFYFNILQFSCLASNNLISFFNPFFRTGHVM